MQSANLSGPFRGCLYYALLGLPQATGLAGGYDFTLFEGCSELTKKEKEVLTLIYYAGYSATEIAAAWGTSKQNVNQIKRRGLGKLKKSLQGEFF